MEDLTRLVSSIPLIETESSHRGIQPELAGLARGGALYFGTGLTTAKAPSIGVPFDLVGMFCVAKRLSVALNLDQVIQLIADTHALSNAFNTPKGVRALANQMMDVSARCARILGIRYVPLLASSFDKDPKYLKILRSINTDDHEYVRREWADIEFLRRHHGLRLKLSWTIGANVREVGFDERLYDLRFRDITGQPMSFVYLLPGRTLDVARPKVSPYISVAGERRILLQHGEDVVGKIKEAQEAQGNQLKGSIKHLAQIVALFEELKGSVKGGTTEEKVQTIIDMICR